MTWPRFAAVDPSCAVKVSWHVKVTARPYSGPYGPRQATAAMWSLAPGVVAMLWFIFVRMIAVMESTVA